MVAVGYSNGANIAASLMLLRPEVLSTAILFIPMVPLVPSPLPTLIKTKIFISAGNDDQMVSYIATLELVKLFQGSGENIVLHWQQSGHELGKREILEARNWLSYS